MNEQEKILLLNKTADELVELYKQEKITLVDILFLAIEIGLKKQAPK